MPGKMAGGSKEAKNRIVRFIEEEIIGEDSQIAEEGVDLSGFYTNVGGNLRFFPLDKYPKAELSALAMTIGELTKGVDVFDFVRGPDDKWRLVVEPECYEALGIYRDGKSFLDSPYGSAGRRGRQLER